MPRKKKNTTACIDAMLRVAKSIREEKNARRADSALTNERMKERMAHALRFMDMPEKEEGSSDE